MPADLMMRIEAHDDLGASHFLLTLGLPPDAPPLERWEPGQFAMISLGQDRSVTDPLLRRPFSIYNVAGAPEGVIQIFYKVLGRGTRLLSGAGSGDLIRCLAPLGNGFTPSREPGDRLLLVAGGIGSASLHPLALSDHRAGGRPVFLYGCRTAEELAGVRRTADEGIEVHTATDDGTAGHHGFVSGLLDSFLTKQSTQSWIVCACGPSPMMKATAEVAAHHGIPCYLSLESPMACGFGVCVGCVVGTRAEPHAPLRYRRICIDGPVFDAREVVW